MDAFEEIVAGLFRQSGLWTWIGYKINLTPQEKKDIGRHSMPRPEIDILAYSPQGNSRMKPLPSIVVERNTLLWVECKSYLDSSGVHIVHGEDNKKVVGIRVFDDKLFREIASRKLAEQVVEAGLAVSEPNIKYCLVAGNIHKGSDGDLRAYFKENKWNLFDIDWLRRALAGLVTHPYENDVAMIVAKLIGQTKD